MCRTLRLEAFLCTGPEKLQAPFRAPGDSPKIGKPNLRLYGGIGKRWSSKINILLYRRLKKREFEVA